jgi:hypothetical protein
LALLAGVLVLAVGASPAAAADELVVRDSHVDDVLALGGTLVYRRVGGPPRRVCPVWYRAHDQGRDEAVVVAPSIGALAQEWTRALESGRGAHVPQTEPWTLDVETPPDGFDRRLL